MGKNKYMDSDNNGIDSRSDDRSFGKRRSSSFSRFRDVNRTYRSERKRHRSKENGERYFKSEEKKEVIEITEADASFILGKGGRTKRKLAQVCGADLLIKQTNGKTTLEIKGSEEKIEKAKLYVGFVMQQRHGPVSLNITPEERDDLTVVEVPHKCVGYVTGTKGRGLRSLEEEWGTLMFFSDLNHEHPRESEKLAIFGEERARRSTQLKVMSSVEQKVPGYYSSHDPSNYISEVEGFDTETMLIDAEDFSYALGREGTTRKKLAKASGGVLEYVGKVAYIAGTRPQRQRARQYLQWLCAQRTSTVHVDTDGRTDCNQVSVPAECLTYVTGPRGQALRKIEEATTTFIFVDGDMKSGAAVERVLIFGENEENRKRAKSILESKIRDRMEFLKRIKARERYARSRSRQRYGDPKYYDRFRDFNNREKGVPFIRRNRSRSRSPYPVYERGRIGYEKRISPSPPFDRRGEPLHFNRRSISTPHVYNKRSVSPIMYNRRSPHMFNRGRSPPFYNKGSPPPFNRRSPPPYNRRSPPPYNRGSPPPYNRRSPPPYNRGSPPPHNRRSPPPYNRRSPPPFNRGSSPPFNRGSSPPFNRGSSPPFNRISPPAYNRRSPHPSQNDRREPPYLPPRGRYYSPMPRH